MPTVRASQASTPQGVYQFMPRWRSGYRYDRLDDGSVDFGPNSANLPLTDYKPTRHSLMLDYSPSEFSRLRLQYSKDKSMESVYREPVVRAVHPQPGQPRRPHILRRTRRETTAGFSHPVAARLCPRRAQRLRLRARMGEPGAANSAAATSRSMPPPPPCRTRTGSRRGPA